MLTTNSVPRTPRIARGCGPSSRRATAWRSGRRPRPAILRSAWCRSVPAGRLVELVPRQRERAVRSRRKQRIVAHRDPDRAVGAGLHRVTACTRMPTVAGSAWPPRSTVTRPLATFTCPMSAAAASVAMPATSSGDGPPARKCTSGHAASVWFVAAPRIRGRPLPPATRMLPEFGDPVEAGPPLFAFRCDAGRDRPERDRPERGGPRVPGAADVRMRGKAPGAPPSAGRRPNPFRTTRTSHVQRAFRHDLRCRLRRRAHCVGAGQAGQWHRRGDTQGSGQGRQEGTGRLDDQALRH